LGECDGVSQATRDRHGAIMTATPARAADSELAGDAASGDVGAYASLYHRHIEAAWRLAQATSASSGNAAAKATTDAFVGVVRLAGRGRDDVADQFRLHLLAAVYREAHRGSDQPPSQGKRKKVGTAAKAVAAGAAGPLLVGAFANLPSRWRVALWLQEVEGLPATSAGAILGVSSAAAVQLKKRALDGLEHRVLQAGGRLPLPALAPTLAATLTPVPGEVRARTEAQWKKAVGRDRRRAAPVAAWMSQRAPGPLAVCAVGLCAVGVIALAVVGQGTTDRPAPAGPVASGAPAGNGTAGSGSGTFSFTSPTNPNSASGATGTSGASGTASTAGTSGTAGTAAASQGPHLVATTPTIAAPVVVTVPTTVPVTQTIPTVPQVTLPPVTLPPVTLPPVTPPPVATPPGTPQPAAATPVLQVALNTGVLGVNVGVGTGGCTGVQLLNIKLGCTGGPPGLSLGGTLLGGIGGR
jgi:DNA-directed RNA polymerase specialized sigma24 family protein